MTEPITDGIIIKARNGDKDAFMQLVSAYEKKVYNIALGLMRNSSDASDMTQETFIKAYKSIKQFRLDCSIGTWLYRIAVNVCKDELRKRKNIISIEYLNDSGIIIEDKTDTFEISDLTYIVKKAIDALSQDFRIVIILIDIQGLSYSEASQILDLPEGTVKSRLNRARTELRNALAKEGLP